MSTQPLISLLDTFAAPQLVFARVREKTIAAWVPITILVLSTALVFGWYFMSVDMYQYMEVSTQVTGQSVSPAELDVILQNESMIRMASIFSVSIVTLIVFLILALYFFLAATLLAEERFGYGQFLSLVAWGSLPGLISLISIGVSFALSDGFLYLSDLDKTSLATILGLGFDNDYFNVASVLTVGKVWSYVLYGIGFAILTRTSVVTASLVGLIPPALHFGLVYLL